MIMIASGHEAMNKVAQEMRTADVVIAHNWDAAKQGLDTVQTVLLGQYLEGFPEETGELEEVVQKRPEIEWILWINEDRAHGLRLRLPATVDFWVGEISQDRFEEWINAHAVKPWEPPKLFALVSGGPGCSRISVVEWITANVTKRYGTGRWVDFDWTAPQLTARYFSRIWHKQDYPYHRLKVQRVSWGGLTPAPPPWQLLTEVPDKRDVQRALGENHAWQGWDLGGDLRSDYGNWLLSKVPAVLMVLDEGTELYSALQIIETVKTLHTEIEVTLVLDRPLAPDERRDLIKKRVALVNGPRAADEHLAEHISRGRLGFNKLVQAFTSHRLD